MNTGKQGEREGLGSIIAAQLKRLGGMFAPDAPVRQGQGRGAGSVGIPSVGLLASFRRYNRAYFQRWLLIGTLIGVVAGVGAIIFASLIAWCSHVLLTGIAGFTPPA
ncbi:MAG: hypothetical protein ACXWP6_07075, partial [Ktedonobacterales bacterium]